eukprot:TRINITY_DN396_c0_g3_i1.p1 TRINITY_DN396_c0_g3~~TRINITY_DN396_c0_g3_i1.p1  ORF type:complete len:59 (-),score=3.12 TRINITY_DN396_c0_g3_i1:366-542(-)
MAPFYFNVVIWNAYIIKERTLPYPKPTIFEILVEFGVFEIDLAHPKCQIEKFFCLPLL